jgi:DNA-binding response OmpR family regulator
MQPPIAVLGVDDDPDICDLVTITLQDKGYEVYQAVDGRDALD